jgi:hypothetical protein
MRPIKVALPRAIVGAMHGVEVLVLDVLDSRIREREFVYHDAHGVAKTCVIGASVEDRCLDDQRLLVRELRPAAVDVASPSLRGEIVRESWRPDAIQPTLEPLWARHLEQATATNVALGLSCVNDVDARGLGLPASLVRRARERGTILSVIAAILRDFLAPNATL